jgi:hypoxanthine phosphoribosyltransferase
VKKQKVAKRSAKPRAGGKVPRIVSIPDDVVLAPQTEAPRHLQGVDRSEARSQIRELTWAEFDRMIQSLARTAQRGFKPDLVVGVAHGGVFVGGAIASAMGCEFFPVRISRRSRDKAPRKSAPRAYGKMPPEVKGKRVLVVDDVAASGETLELACQLAIQAGARELETACLIARPGGFEPTFCALPTDAFVVFPWDYEPVVEDRRFGSSSRK